MAIAVSHDVYLPFLHGQGFLDIALHTIQRHQVFDHGAGLSQYVENKNRLRKQSEKGGPLVLAMQPDSFASQCELLEFVRQDESERRERYTGKTDTPSNAEIERVSSDIAEPLWDTSLRVKEDLCILQPRGNSYCLTAASLCAPSGWSLQEGMGQSIEQLHGPVPDLNAQRAIQIDRLLLNVKADRFYRRFNWSLKQHDNLADFPAADIKTTADQQWHAAEDSIFLRIEKQTLFKLPETQSIVFCILVSTMSLEDLFSRFQCQIQLKNAILALSPEQKHYKGIGAIADYLIESL